MGGPCACSEGKKCAEADALKLVATKMEGWGRAPKWQVGARGGAGGDVWALRLPRCEH